MAMSIRKQRSSFRWQRMEIGRPLSNTMPCIARLPYLRYTRLLELVSWGPCGMTSAAIRETQVNHHSTCSEKSLCYHRYLDKITMFKGWIRRNSIHCRIIIHVEVHLRCSAFPQLHRIPVINRGSNRYLRPLSGGGLPV